MPGEEIVTTNRDNLPARIIAENRTSLSEVQKAVKDLRALRGAMVKRRGFKALTDKEIRSATNQGRP
jgi:hypothetical protein